MPTIAFIDECGDHGLAKIDPASPVFVLAAAVYDFDTYVGREIPAMARFKIGRWGHEGVVLHSHSIRKRRGDFSFCVNPEAAQKFHEEIADFVRTSTATIVAAAIDKPRHIARYSNPRDPYFLSIQFILERIHMWKRSGDAKIKVVFESRGRAEDAKVREWCDRVCGGENYTKKALGFEVTFSTKRQNVGGLQIADLAAYPISRFVMDRNTIRPDWLAVRERLRTGPEGGFFGYGLKVFPA